MIKLARALTVLVGALVLLYAADLALLGWWTSDPMIVQLDAEAPAESAPDSSVEGGDTLPDQSAAQERLYQDRAYSGLATWATATAGLAGLIIVSWCALVFAREKATFGPASQGSAFLYWILLVAAYFAGAVGAFFWLIAPMELIRYINDFDFYLLIGVVALLGALAIWIASLFGIGPVLRPSVPLGARFS